MSDYYQLVTSTTNDGRYEAGRLLIPVASTVIPIVGQIGKTAKVSKIKDALKAIRQSTKSQLDELNQALVTKARGAGVRRFIAQSGTELRTYLNSLTELPTGIIHEGNMYRNIPHNTPAYDPRHIVRSASSDIENRFTTGLYLSEAKSGNIFEAIHYNGGTSGRDLYVFSNVKVEKLLDLSDEQTLAKLGTTLEQMQLVKDKGQYEFTNVIATWAKEKGYSGIKFKGARGEGVDYYNFVIFDESTVSKSLNKYEQIDW